MPLAPSNQLTLNPNSPILNNFQQPVQLDALQRAAQSGGLTPVSGTGLASSLTNTTNTPVSTSQINQATKTGGLTTPQSAPSTSSPGFLGWLSSLWNAGQGATQGNNQGASALDAYNSSSSVITPSYSTPPPFGSSAAPAGSGEQANRPAPITTTTSQGVGTTKITGVTGDKANAIQNAGTNQQDADLLKNILDEGQKRRDAQNAALQGKINELTQNEGVSDQNKQDSLAQLLAIQQNLNELTPEEQQAQAQLDNLQGSLGLGMADLANQPINVGFITGQQAALEKRVGALQQPIQSKLSRLQAARQARNSASLDVAKTRYQAADEASKSLKENKKGLYTQQQDLQKAGDTEYSNFQGKVFDSALRSREQANNPNNRYVSIGDGSKLYDTQTGQTVANNPKSFAPKTTPNSYGQTNIPANIKNDLTADVGKQGVTLEQLYQAYPEVSTGYISQLYNSLHPKSGSVGSYGGQ